MDVITQAFECIGCGKSTSADRCEWCGVARAVEGFTTTRVLAQGTHGRVYAAMDSAGQNVALKELQFVSVPSIQQIDAFEREAQTLKTVSHPAIPRFIKSFSMGSGMQLRLYLASELIEGEPLSTRLRRGRMDLPALRELAEQVLDVLVFLHDRPQPLLHRDIKPDNLILKPDGRYVLVDFGSARLLTSARTFGSTLVGTFGYMPPEQLGGTVDVTSDLYALGATLLHAATGKAPADWVKPDLSLPIPEEVPTVLRPILERMLKLRPEQRFSSARAVRAALAEATSLTPWWRKSVSPRAVFLSCTVVLVVGALMWGLSGVRGAPPRAAFVEPVVSSTDWFTSAKPYCNTVEVAQYVARRPPPSGWAGAGQGAACWALAGKIGEARRLLDALPGDDRWRAAGIVFNT
ncbi:MAG TPA: serine/threonine-protein kinase, partial [Myxococcaceae bacterium]|nr:serine/threonine-protein kinase [Myxococcaceae bacterium]